MSGERNCALFQDEAQGDFFRTSIEYVLNGFSTKRFSSIPLFAYGQHQDLRLVGEGSVWKLHVYPLKVKIRGNLLTNWIGCFLSLESVLDVEAECTYTFRIRDRSGETLFVRNTLTHILGKRNGEQIHAGGFTYAFSHEDLENSLLFDDNLHIYVDIHYSLVGSAVKRFTPSAMFLNALQKQSMHDFGDILLVCSDAREIRTHKFILAMHSAVFTAMFKHPLKETATVICVIEDLDGATVSAMVSYMSGKNEWNPKMAEKLVVAADKYNIVPLEKACVEELIKQINIENVLGFLSLADDHCLELLQIKSQDFIAANMGHLDV